jgi:hypothetical protein
MLRGTEILDPLHETNFFEKFSVSQLLKKIALMLWYKNFIAVFKITCQMDAIRVSKTYVIASHSVLLKLPFHP